ncbi:MAG TPA: hypothetical protein VGK73_38840 [Polyangiaceae bacterium]
MWSMPVWSMHRARQPASAVRTLAAALLVATACDCRATVTPKSTVLGDVRVEIAGSKGMCGGDPTIGDFEVYRGSSELVWAAAFITSSEYPTVHQIKYGTPPPGFTEQKAAAPLAANDSIEFRVHGPGFRGEVRLVVKAQ